MSTDLHTNASDEEKQHHLLQSSSPVPVDKKSNKKRNIIIALCAVFIVVIPLAIGLGVGLSGKKKSGSNVGNSLSNAGDDDSRAGLQESGSYLTSYLDDSIQFSWTQTNYTILNGTPSSNNFTISVDTSDVGQKMDGFGAALTDAAAQLFANLKSANLDAYNSAMDDLFSLRTGINILRVPIGTTDFSPESLQYTMADQKGVQVNANDTQGPLSNFNMDGANTYIIPFLKDALQRNSNLKISLLPWSPPAWMKTSNTINSGSLQQGSTNVLTEYLVKSIQGFRDAIGATPWSLSVQNEPSHPTAYPSMSMNNDYEVVVLATLRGRLAEVGLGSVQLWGHEDNYIGWSDAADLINYNETSLDGISWHCYNGSSSLITNFQAALNPLNTSKSLHMSECSGQSSNGAPSSTGLQWWMNNIFNQPSQGISSITVWNLALDADNGPHLNNAYCTQCVGSLEINNGQATNNLQKLLLSHHASAASDLTRFGGGVATRVGSTVSGNANNCIASTLAFSASWDNSTSRRIGLVVQNICSRTISTTVTLNDHQYFEANIENGVTTMVLTV